MCIDGCAPYEAISEAERRVDEFPSGEYHPRVGRLVPAGTREAIVQLSEEAPGSLGAVVKYLLCRLTTRGARGTSGDGATGAGGAYQELKEVVTADGRGRGGAGAGEDFVSVEEKRCVAATLERWERARISPAPLSWAGRSRRRRAQTGSPGGITHYSGFIVAAGQPCGGATTNAWLERCASSEFPGRS